MTFHTGTWATGTPCWAECASNTKHRGLHHAKDFYGPLFGWHVVDADGIDDYLICLKDEQPAAALTVTGSDDQSPAWTVYFATHDVEATAAKVHTAGGRVDVGPQDVGPAGRAALCTDPTGASFGLWEAGDHAGFGIVNEPGTVAWNTLLTRDLAAAKAFYAQVFDYRYMNESEYGAVVHLGDEMPVCGIHLAEQLPDGAEANWLTHFGVVDRDSSAQMALDMDAEVLMSYDGPLGPEAIIQTEHGEVFSLVQLPDDE